MSSNISISQGKDVERFFDSYASDFNSIYQVDERPIINKTIDKWARSSMFLRFERVYQICQEIGAKNLLDVGCGPGYHDTILAKGLNINITGVDVSDNMIKIAEEATKEAGVQNICSFEVADFMKFQSDKKFDAVLSLGVVEYIMDPEPFIKRMMTFSNNVVMFSLPVKWHWLTPQRVIRYKARHCPLKFYSYFKLANLLQAMGVNYKIDRLKRDYIVTIRV
jgi:2-polyprenyl-3-methyl-5-hydroxy-6-metoxy-1,4-benzoquinol methylase